ncbi:MAG: hypothetical protein AAF632_08910 [Bacteroidota bacterium]
MKKILRDIFIQLITVAVGVYLGIVASDWKQDKSDVADQREFLDKLSLEIENNRIELEGALAYHQTIIKDVNNAYSLSEDTLQSNFSEMGSWRLLPGWRGADRPAFQQSVYQSGIIKNTFADLDFDMISRIEETYNFQKEYYTYYQLLVFDPFIGVQTVALSEERELKTETMLNSLDGFNDLVQVDSKLLEHYTNTLDSIASYSQSSN